MSIQALSSREPKARDLPPISEAARRIVATVLDPAHRQEVRVEIPRVSRRDLAEAFCGLGYLTGAEIGVEKGLFAAELCERNPGLSLIAVDAWQSYGAYRPTITAAQHNEFYAKAKVRLSGYNVEVRRQFSLDAAKDVPDASLDFVYIDANHERTATYADICAWAPKVRVGGMVAGHDWCRGHQLTADAIGVIDAVTDYAQQHRIFPVFVFGDTGIVPNTTRERPRSWGWIVQ